VKRGVLGNLRKQRVSGDLLSLCGFRLGRGRCGRAVLIIESSRPRKRGWVGGRVGATALKVRS